jgi:hypothetical protein
MAKSKRTFTLIREQWCQQYMTQVTLFVEKRKQSGRRLVAQYEEGSYEDRMEFAASIPESWSHEDILRLLDLPDTPRFPV